MSRNERAATMRHVPRADRWLPMTPEVLGRIPANAREWLGWPDSLTERLTSHLGDPVTVRVLSERSDRVLADERNRLGVMSRIARIREVQLEVRGTAYVVARTVFPDTTARVMNNALRRLGNQSLGSLLFGKMRAPVYARELIRLDPAAPLWRVLRNRLPSVQHLWARRALHQLHDRPLLVTEIFLPSLLAQPSAHD